MGKGRSSKLTRDTRLYKWRTESQLPRVKREGWSKAGGKGGFGRPREGGCNGDMPIITVPVSIPTEVLYSRALGDWGKAMHDLGIISCNSANPLFKKILLFIYTCVHVFATAHSGSQRTARGLVLLFPCVDAGGPWTLSPWIRSQLHWSVQFGV